MSLPFLLLLIPNSNMWHADTLHLNNAQAHIRLLLSSRLSEKLSNDKWRSDKKKKETKTQPSLNACTDSDCKFSRSLGPPLKKGAARADEATPFDLTVYQQCVDSCEQADVRAVRTGHTASISAADALSLGGTALCFGRRSHGIETLALNNTSCVSLLGIANQI